MPISSTDVANIIQSQVGMFSATAQYAQAVSAQYGYQSMGGMGVNDPRAAQAQQALSGGNIGAGLARAPGMAMGGLGLAAAFGFGPRYLDPFTTAIHAGGMAKRYGGWAGAIGAGAGMLGAGMAVGGAMNWGTNQMVFGAQNRGVANAQMAQMFPNRSMSQLGAMSSQVEAMASMGAGSMRQLTALMKQASGTGDIQTGSITEFQSSFQQLVAKVRSVATVLNQSLTDAHQTMRAVKGMGISGDDAAGFVGTMKGIGMTIGATPQQMMGIANQASQMGRSLGMDPGEAATGGLVNAGVYGVARKQDLIAGLDPGSRQRYTKAAFRFFGSRRGSRVLGAMMTPMGELDTDAASSIAGGSMSAEEITRRYQANIINSPGSRDMLRARSGELAGQFVSQFGAQGIAPAVRETVESSGTMNPESLTRSLTGLHRRDVAAMEMLASRSSEIRSRISQEAKAGFRQGQQSMGITQAVSKAIDQLVKPIRTQFQRIGANISQSVSEAMEDVGIQLSGRPSPGIGGGLDIERLRSRAQATNNPQLAQFLDQGLASVRGTRDYFSTGGPEPTTAFGRFARDFLPTGMQFGAYGAGTSPGELPFGGLGLREYQPMQSAVLGGLAFGGRGLGMATDQLARGAAWMGRGASRLAGISGMPWGGHGILSGTARLGTGASWLGLKGVGMLGRAGGALGMPLLAYDAITNTGPQYARQRGMMGLSGVTGNQARLVNFLGQAGAFDAPDGTRGYYTADVGSSVGGIGAGDVARGDYTPVGGLIDSGGVGGPGQQNVLTREGRRSAMEFFSGASDFGGLRDKLADKLAQRYGGRKKALDKIDDALKESDVEGKSDAQKATDLASKLGIASGSPDHKLLLQMAVGKPNFFTQELSPKNPNYRTDPGYLEKQIKESVGTDLARSVLTAVQGASNKKVELSSYLREGKIPDIKSGAELFKYLSQNMTTDQAKVFGEASRTTPIIGEGAALTGVGTPGEVSRLERGIHALMKGGHDLSKIGTGKNPYAGPLFGKAGAGNTLMSPAAFGMQLGELTRGGGMGLSRALLTAQTLHLQGDQAGQKGLERYLMSTPGWGRQVGTRGGGITAQRMAAALLKGGEGSISAHYGLLGPAMAERESSNQEYLGILAGQLHEEGGAARFTANQMARAVMSPDLNLQGRLHGAAEDYEIKVGDGGNYEDNRLSVMENLIRGKGKGEGLFEGMSQDDINAIARQGGLSQSRFGQRVGLAAGTYGRMKRMQTRSTAGGKFNRAKFLNALLPGQRFDRLNSMERGYLTGNAGGYTPRLERMLLEGAQGILRSHNIQATEAESRSLSEDIAAGLHDPSGKGMENLRERLSTMSANQPASPGAAGGGGGKSTQNLLAGFDKLATAANTAAVKLGQIGQ